MDPGCHACNVPVWPSNTTNELLYGMQTLFSRDNHNHDQVLDEKTYNLPLLVPENQVRPPFTYCNSTSGRINAAPYNSDNVMHINWVPSRLETNQNTSWGSDANIYFDKVAPAGEFVAWKDWLDVNAEKVGPKSGKSIDQKVAGCCASANPVGCASANPAGGNGGQVCEQTCIDWWTNRPVPPQGILTQADGTIGGGCPWGTLKGLSCYPCAVHNTYVRGKL